MSDQPSYPPPGPQGYTPPPAGPQGYTPPPAGPQGYTPPPPARRSNRRGLVVLAVAVVVLVVIFGGYFLFRDQLTGNVNELQVGDCIDVPGVSTTVTDVQHHPCGEPHDAEIFALVTDPANGDYPGDDHFRGIATAQCVPAASTYLGTDFNSRDELDAGFYYPTTDSWSHGDRGIICYLYRIDGGKLTVSVHGIGDSPLPTP
jgi:hypothetical protein